MKDKVVPLILGVAISIVLLVLLVGFGYLGYKSGAYIIDKAEAISRPRAKAVSISLPPELNLSFESAKEVEIFTSQESDMKISDKFATAGNHSLLVEFPASRPTPGILFDIIGSGCLDWSKMRMFTVDVFNSVPANANIAVRIKSGEKYPKRVFMKNFNLTPESTTKIILERKELERALDLSKISYLGFIMSDPPTTFKLYFDEMKVIMNDGK